MKNSNVSSTPMAASAMLSAVARKYPLNSPMGMTATTLSMSNRRFSVGRIWEIE